MLVKAYVSSLLKHRVIVVGHRINARKLPEFLQQFLARIITSNPADLITNTVLFLIFITTTFLLRIALSAETSPSLPQRFHRIYIRGYINQVVFNNLSQRFFFKRSTNPEMSKYLLNY